MKIYLLQYSLTGGVIIALFMVLSMWLLEQGFSYSLCELIGYLSMLLGFSTIYLALKKVRDTHLNGKISFGKAFKIALLMLALVALIYALIWLVYVQMSGGEFMNDFFEKSINDIRASGKPEAEIEASVKQLESQASFYKKPLVQMGIALIEIVPVGLLASLLSAYMVSKK